ncbi:MAG: alpha/beta fold hydrolase, partial [Pseudomonadota bacterium]
RIYLHGAGLNAESWGEVDGHALNLPGHGGRPRARRARAECFATEIARDVPQGATLIGYSLGGMVAMAFAAAYPERVRALVLVDTPIRAPLRIISWYTPFVGPVVTRVPGLKAIGKAVGSRIENPEGQARFRAHIEAASPSGMADALTVAGRFDGARVLPSLKMPMLVLCGKRSLLTGKKYRAFVREAAPHARIVEMETGHHIPFDDPAGLEGQIAEFIAGL